MLTAAQLTTAKTQKRPKCPWTDKWIKKNAVPIYEEYYSYLKKNEIKPFAATWMDLEIIILSQKEKEIPHDITYM